MKYCNKCQKLVNVNRNTVNIGIADIWNDHCEECRQFIDSGFEHTKDLIFDMSEGIDNCKVKIKQQEEVENLKDLNIEQEITKIVVDEMW